MFWGYIIFGEPDFYTSFFGVSAAWDETFSKKMPGMSEYTFVFHMTFLYTHWSTVDVSATGLASQPCGKPPKRTLRPYQVAFPKRKVVSQPAIFIGKLRRGNQASFRLLISIYVYILIFRGYVKLGSCIPDLMNSIQNLRPTPLQLALQCSRGGERIAVVLSAGWVAWKRKASTWTNPILTPSYE